MKKLSSDGRIDRRTAIRWMAASMATITLLNAKSFGETKKSKRYGADPDVISPEVTWSLTLTAAQLLTVTALCDLIIPADDKSSSASQVHVPDFIDEWISAPYDEQAADCEIILNGLVWLDIESQRRFSKQFASLSLAQQSGICDEICYLPKASVRNQEAAMFFAKFRNLTSGGFYTTAQGMKDVGYVGNTPLPEFKGPPREVLEHLGLV